MNYILSSFRNNYVLFLFFLFVQFNNLDAQKIINCKTGIYLKTIKINQIDETFDVDFYYWLRVDSINLNENYEFIKDVEFINSSNLTNEILEEKVDSIEKYYYVNGFCKSTFPYKSNFKNFPFDKQNLNIEIENTIANNTKLLYIPDNRFFFINKMSDNNIDILNGGLFKVSELNFNTTNYEYKTNFGDPSIKKYDVYSRLNFNIKISHNAFEVFQKISLPLLVVLILAYLVFYIPAHDIGTASALTVTSLLAAIAFQWTIYDSLPKVSYITLMDKIFYLVFFFIFYAMAQTVFTFNLSEGTDKQKKISIKLELYSRYLFPILFLISLFLLIYFI